MNFRCYRQTAMHRLSHTDRMCEPSRPQLCRQASQAPPDRPIRTRIGSLVTPRTTGAASSGSFDKARAATGRRERSGTDLSVRLRFIGQALRVQLRTAPTVTGMMSLTSTVKR